MQARSPIQGRFDAGRGCMRSGRKEGRRPPTDAATSVLQLLPVCHHHAPPPREVPPSRRRRQQQQLRSSFGGRQAGRAHGRAARSVGRSDGCVLGKSRTDERESKQGSEKESRSFVRSNHDVCTCVCGVSSRYPTRRGRPRERIEMVARNEYTMRAHIYVPDSIIAPIAQGSHLILVPPVDSLKVHAAHSAEQKEDRDQPDRKIELHSQAIVDGVWQIWAKDERMAMSGAVAKRDLPKSDTYLACGIYRVGRNNNDS